MTDDYSQRSEIYGFATREEIKEALKYPNVVCLDVRTEDEIAAQPYETDKKWVHSGCRPTTCPVLEKMPEKLLPDKDGKQKNCVKWKIFCSGTMNTHLYLIRVSFSAQQR